MTIGFSKDSTLDLVKILRFKKKLQAKIKTELRPSFHQRQRAGNIQEASHSSIDQQQFTMTISTSKLLHGTRFKLLL